MQYDRTIIGYHGCSAESAEAILDGAEFKQSENAYDWLGKGIYFWEYGLDRAWVWARTNEKSKDSPAVIGAIIQLGKCFDLLDTRFTSVLEQTAPIWVGNLTTAGKRVPKNAGPNNDLKGRNFDCALVNWTLDYLETEQGAAYQCVRGSFPEGAPVYLSAEAQSAILKESHIQIAVRDPACILGTFRPRR